jgi:hypothetical protein
MNELLFFFVLAKKAFFLEVYSFPLILTLTAAWAITTMSSRLYRCGGGAKKLTGNRIHDNVARNQADHVCIPARLWGHNAIQKARKVIHTASYAIQAKTNYCFWIGCFSQFAIPCVILICGVVFVRDIPGVPPSAKGLFIIDALFFVHCFLAALQLFKWNDRYPEVIVLSALTIYISWCANRTSWKSVTGFWPRPGPLVVQGIFRTFNFDALGLGVVLPVLRAPRGLPANREEGRESRGRGLVPLVAARTLRPPCHGRPGVRLDRGRALLGPREQEKKRQEEKGKKKRGAAIFS